MTETSNWILVGSVCLLACLGATVALAGDAEKRFEPRTFEGQNGEKLLYRLLKPKDYDATRKYPLVIFMHGAGERGDDNVKQLVHGMNDFASDAIMEQYPCFVVAPQCPDEEKWVDTPWSAESHKMPEKPAPALALTIEAVAQLQKEFSIDPTRLYVTGLSMGGYGTWDAIQRWPDRFAAAVPICGGGDPAQAEKIKNIPIWAFHGDQDTAVKPQRSRQMIEAIKEAGGKPKYTEYKDTGHDSWTATYRDPELYRWLFAQRLTPKPKSP